jgi:hypothetical protein
MQLSGDIKANFNTLQTACKTGRLAVLDCHDARTGEHVPVVVAINGDGEEYAFVPLAKMFVSNLHEELNRQIPRAVIGADCASVYGSDR